MTCWPVLQSVSITRYLGFSFTCFAFFFWYFRRLEFLKNDFFYLNLFLFIQHTVKWMSNIILQVLHPLLAFAKIKEEVKMFLFLNLSFLQHLLEQKYEIFSVSTIRQFNGICFFLQDSVDTDSHKRSKKYHCILNNVFKYMNFLDEDWVTKTKKGLENILLRN